MGDELKTVIGACPAARDALLDLWAVTLSVSVTGSAAYDDPSIPISQTSDIAGGAERAWARIALPPVGQEIVAPPPPGQDYFYLIQYACACCKCRYAFAFDDNNVPVPENNAEGVPIGSTSYFTGAPLAATIPIAVTGSSGFDTPPEDPPDTGIGIWMWNHNSPPCKKADGPATPWPYLLYVGLPAPSFPPFDGDVTTNRDESFSISGSDNVQLISDLDAPSPGIGFYATFDVDACDLQPHTYTLEFNYNLSFSDDDTGATLSYGYTASMEFTIGGTGGGSNTGDGGLSVTGLTTADGLATGGLATSGGLGDNTTLTTGLLSTGALSDGGLTTGSLSTDSLD